MENCPHKDTKQLVIDGTVYTVTSYFKQQGHTAGEHIKRMIERAAKEQKVKKSL